MTVARACCARQRRTGGRLAEARAPALLLSAFLAFLLPALGARAQLPGPFHLEEGRFYIETITVENNRALSAEIIVSESLLAPNTEYTESQLSDAIHRIRRLPLILDAELSLRKGSARGRYELVISVRESRLWFWGLDIDIARWSEPVSVNGLETTDTVAGSSGLVGRRFPAGRHGLLYLAAGGTEGTIQAGYTRYDLFNRGGVLGLSFGYADCRDRDVDTSPSDPGDGGCQTEFLGLGLDPTSSSWSALDAIRRFRLTLGLPLEGNSSLRLVASYRSSNSGLRRQTFATDPRLYSLYRNRRDVGLNLSWVSNSVDDPVFPTSGTLIEAGVDIKHLAADITQIDLARERDTVVAEGESLQAGLLLLGTHHFPIGQRQELSLGGELFAGASRIRDMPLPDLELVDSDGFAWTAAATAGHGIFLKRTHSALGRWRDLRWESSAQLFASGLASNPWKGRVPKLGFRIATGLTYRNTWGVLRLQLAYVTVEDR